MPLFTIGSEAYGRQDPASAEGLRSLAAINRINALSCIESARHGWLGATYSCCEILTALYFRCHQSNVILSKGHAAPMQYACLAGLGRIDEAHLLTYKDGPGSLQAHADRSTPGVLVNSGSLGQALSKTAGLAWARPSERYAVILGDGELQEGQNWEAFATIVHRELANVTAIIDCNGFQSELAVDQVKGIHDLPALLAALGLQVLEIDGHDGEEVAKAWAKGAARPTAIVARTVKAGGSRFLAPEGDRQPWHGRVPDDALYLAILAEQIELANDDRLSAAFESWRDEFAPTLEGALGPRPRSEGTSTRDGFSDALVRAVEEREDVVVLDADLAKPCGLSSLEEHERFLEMGIAEQDLVSFAGGLALAGRLPVVNTYAAFLKRAFEQIYVNATEGGKVIYGGHYGGLCYHTDGKTHTSLGDMTMMLDIPGMLAVDPTWPAEAEALFDWAMASHDDSPRGPVYFRLRRTPAALPAYPSGFRPDRPTVVAEPKTACFVTSGTVATRLALDCREFADFASWGLLVQSIFHGVPDRAWWVQRLAHTKTIVTIEDSGAPGPLAVFMGRLLGDIDVSPRLVTITADGFGGSFRTLEAALRHFDFSVDAVRARIDTAT